MGNMSDYLDDPDVNEKVLLEEANLAEYFDTEKRPFYWYVAYK